MSDLDHARAILHVAERDLRSLKAVEDVPDFADEQYGFLAQQAAEKALKAWLAGLSQTYPFTHNLILLLRLLQGCQQDVDRFWSLAEYNPYAVGFRYGEVPLDAEVLDRAEVIARIEDVIERVREALQERSEEQKEDG